MTDIVERLREGCGCNFPETTCMAESECRDAFEAADTITALRGEVERLGRTNDAKREHRDRLLKEVARLREALEKITGKGGPDLAGCIAIARSALTGKEQR